MTLTYDRLARVQLRLPLTGWAPWRTLTPALPPTPDLAEVRRAAQAALAGCRSAAALAQVVAGTADEVAEPPGTRLTPVAPALPAAARLLAETQALAALAQRLAQQAEALRALAESLQPSPEACRLAWTTHLAQHRDEHAALVEQAAGWLAGGEPLHRRHLSAAPACALGEWCAGPGAQACDHLPVLAAVTAPHHAFHGALARLAFAQQQHLTAAAEHGLCALRSAQAQLTTALEQLAAGLLNSDADLLLGLDPRGAAPQDHLGRLAERLGLEALWTNP